MSKTYDCYSHTHVLVDVPPQGVNPDERDTAREAWRGPQAIVLVTDHNVWVPASYSHEVHPEIKRVGDGRDSGYDSFGCCVLSVPRAWCKAWYTEEEAEAVERCLEADDDLLGYAM